MRRFILPAAALIWAATATAPAQQLGDLCLSHYNGGYFVSTAPRTALGNLTTILRSGGYSVNGVLMEAGNNAVLAPMSLGLHRLTAGGGATTLTALPNGSKPIGNPARDQDGSILMTLYTSTPNLASILRVDPSNNLTTLASRTRTVFESLARDEGTGDFITITDLGVMLSVDRVTGAMSTVTTLPQISGKYISLDFVAASDRFVVALDLYTGGEIALMTRGGTIEKRVPISATDGRPMCIVFNEHASLIHCGTDTGRLITLASDGTRLSHHDYTGHVRAIEVWGDHPISIRTSGKPGSLLEIKLGFTRSGGNAYGLAFSAGLGNGIQVGNQHLHANLDQLFFATVTQLPGFVGLLDANGAKTVNFTIPQIPAGLRFYVTGFAQNAAVPGGFDLGNTECLRIE